MTNTEAAQLVAILHGAYPGTYFDGAVAEVFTNSLLASQYDVALEAVSDWVQRVDHFPTVAEINGAIRRINERHQAPSAVAPSAVASKAAAREAFSRGYIRARTEAGEAMETITPKLEEHLRAWKLDEASGSALLGQQG